MVVATAVIGFCIGLGVAYLVSQDDTLGLGDRIFLGLFAVVTMTLVPTAMAVYLQ